MRSTFAIPFGSKVFFGREPLLSEIKRSIETCLAHPHPHHQVDAVRRRLRPELGESEASAHLDAMIRLSASAVVASFVERFHAFAQAFREELHSQIQIMKNFPFPENFFT